VGCTVQSNEGGQARSRARVARAALEDVERALAALELTVPVRRVISTPSGAQRPTAAAAAARSPHGTSSSKPFDQRESTSGSACGRGQPSTSAAPDSSSWPAGRRKTSPRPRPSEVHGRTDVGSLLELFGDGARPGGQEERARRAPAVGPRQNDRGQGTCQVSAFRAPARNVSH